VACGGCTGACCAVFIYPDPADIERFARMEDGAFIADMLIPLDLVSAAERMEKFGFSYWADQSLFDWDGRNLSGDGRRLMTCKHWDQESGLCGVYDNRPMMCREYPYYACDYRCGFSLTFEQMWDRVLRIDGPEEGTPPNIIRSNN
jgi:Fe-S-cluster containining protein